MSTVRKATITVEFAVEFTTDDAEDIESAYLLHYVDGPKFLTDDEVAGEIAGWETVTVDIDEPDIDEPDTVAAARDATPCEPAAKPVTVSRIVLTAAEVAAVIRAAVSNQERTAVAVAILHDPFTDEYTAVVEVSTLNPGNDQEHPG
jgi:hypothetical protein